MCGIIGIFNEKEGVAKEKILRGLKSIENRGRDGFGLSNGLWVEFGKELGKLEQGDSDKNLIGHCLHSVVDFVPQPIRGEHGRGCEKGHGNEILAANCEIYNWKELNEKYNLGADNDAHLILKLIEKKCFESVKTTDGAMRMSENIKTINEAVEELDGDFSFA